MSDARIARASSVGLAFIKLRRAVMICCWAFGFAAALQMFVWSLLTFTDARYEVIETDEDVPLVIEADEQPRTAAIPGHTGATPVGVPAQDDLAQTDAVSAVVASSYDPWFSWTVDVSNTLGVLTLLVALPLLGVGVILGAGSAAPGSERTVGAFLGGLLLVAAVLPLNEHLPAPWLVGALHDYPSMVTAVESARMDLPAGVAASTEPLTASASLSFYARFLMLPIACVVTAVVVGVRFGSGVEAALIAAESQKLDPALENEISKIKPSSLHGGGAASGAFTRALQAEAARASGGKRRNADDDSSPQTPPSRESGRMPSATKVSAGEVPRRLI